MRILLIVLLAMILPIRAFAADQPAKEEVKPYPLKVCLVAGDDLDEDAKSMVYKGQEIKFCCNKCKATFEKDPEKYLKKLADASKQDDKPKPKD